MLFGLLTALFWGISDYLIRLLGGRVTLRTSLVWTQGIAATVVLGASLASGHVPYATVDIATIPMLALAALTGAIGLGLLFFAFQTGRVVVVAPLTGSYAIIATLLGLAAGTERLAWPVLAVIALISFGALMVMSHDDQGREGHSHLGTVAAVASAFASGIAIWLTVAFVLPRVAVPDVLLTNFGVLAVAALLWGRPSQVTLPAGREAWGLIAGIAIGTVGGYGAYNLGLERNGIAVASILSTLSSAITVLLAAILSKETVGRSQKVGIAIILVGLPLLAAFRESAARTEPSQWNQTLGSVYLPTPFSRSMTTGARPPAIGYFPEAS